MKYYYIEQTNNKGDDVISKLTANISHVAEVLKKCVRVVSGQINSRPTFCNYNDGLISIMQNGGGFLFNTTNDYDPTDKTNKHILAALAFTYEGNNVFKINYLARNLNISGQRAGQPLITTFFSALEHPSVVYLLSTNNDFYTNKLGAEYNMHISERKDENEPDNVYLEWMAKSGNHKRKLETDPESETYKNARGITKKRKRQKRRNPTNKKRKRNNK